MPCYFDDDPSQRFMAKIYDNIDYPLLKAFDCTNVEMDCVPRAGLGYALGARSCPFSWAHA